MSIDLDAEILVLDGLAAEWDKVPNHHQAFDQSLKAPGFGARA